jgi:hypothetical protein
VLRALGIFQRERVRGAVHQRRRERDRQVCVDQLVLDRLERTDRAAELFARLHVTGGHLEHACAQTDQLGGAAERCAIERLAEQLPREIAARQQRFGARLELHAHEVPGAID